MKVMELVKELIENHNPHAPVEIDLPQFWDEPRPLVASVMGGKDAKCVTIVGAYVPRQELCAR